METRGRTDRAEWQKRIERWQHSGLSVEQFATELGINAGMLSYWKYHLGKEARGESATTTKPARMKASDLVEMPAPVLVADALSVWPPDRLLELAPAHWKQTLEQPETQQKLLANVF